MIELRKYNMKGIFTNMKKKYKKIVRFLFSLIILYNTFPLLVYANNADIPQNIETENEILSEDLINESFEEDINKENENNNEILNNENTTETNINNVSLKEIYNEEDTNTNEDNIENETSHNEIPLEDDKTIEEIQEDIIIEGIENNSIEQPPIEETLVENILIENNLEENVVVEEQLSLSNENTSYSSPVNWNDIPHTLIEYNTYDEYDDARSAVYSDDSYIYFDIYSEMPEHLAEAGGEFTSGITVLFNEDWSTSFNPRFVAVDDNGNMIWDPQLSLLENGDYHFYVCSRDAWHTSTSIEELHEMDLIYGDAYISLTENKDQMYWNLDKNMVANKLGVSPDELKTIGVQYLRLGEQWSVTAGTPTRPYTGIVLCISSVIICVFISRKLKKV